MTFAQRYPEDVAGMVLLDATSPGAFTELQDFSASNGAMVRLYGVAASLSRLGLGQLLGVSPRGIRSQLGELSQLPTALVQARQLSDFGGKPLAVVTASEGQQAGWSAAQARMATLSTNSLHRVVPATHQSLVTDEGDSSHSVGAIADLVRSVRTRSALPTS